MQHMSGHIYLTSNGVFIYMRINIANIWNSCLYFIDFKINIPICDKEKVAESVLSAGQPRDCCGSVIVLEACWFNLDFGCYEIL